MIPLDHIHIGEAPLPTYLENQEASEGDLSVLPSEVVAPDKCEEDTLFYLCFPGQKIPVGPQSIEHYETFCYWLGVSGDRNKEEVIKKKGKWSLKVLDSPGAFLECEITRPSPYRFNNHSVQYIPLGWHQVLPASVTEEARQQKWRIRVATPEECETGPSRTGDPYCSDGFVRTLTSIPVEFYSIGEDRGRKEKTVEVDIRNFRNMQVFLRYQRQLFGEEKRACNTILDLFDAMLANKARWHVDERNELIYLPCIRRPPECFYRLVKMKRTGNQTPSYCTLTESKGFHDLVENLYPPTFAGEEVPLETLKQETVQRLKSSGSKSKKFNPGNGMIVTRNWIYYVVPSVMSI